MTDARSSARRRRPALDPRLLIGVGLVVASVTGVVAIVGASDARTAVFAAADTLVPGDAVHADGLVVRWVALDDAEGLYLTSDDLPSTGLVATEPVRRGELVPRSAVGSVEGSGSTSLVIAVEGGVSGSVVPGARVDVWASTRTGGDVEAGLAGGFGPPAVVTPDARVVRVVEDDGIVSAGEGPSVEVLVPRSRVARLLQAIANGDSLAVVPAGIPLSSR